MRVTQTDFRGALLDPEKVVPDGLTDPFGAPAGKRFSVYRNNVAVSLTEALMQSFPIIHKLIGDENFKKLAAVFLRAHPPRSPILVAFGEPFPAFLETFNPLAHIGYLPDVARLENAMRTSYHAADAKPIEPAALVSLSEHELNAARFAFAPAMQVISSPWPLFDIWRYNTAEAAPKPRAEAQDVLVGRPEFDPTVDELPEGGAVWIAATLEGQTLGRATELATGHSSCFDLSRLLGLLLSRNAIVELKL